MTHYKLICSAGVLVQGASPDFLVCIAVAREAKAVWSKYLPESSLRVQFFYPNRKRVPSGDVSAALAALADPKVAASVARRRAAAAQITSVRSEARADGIFAAVGRGLEVAVDVDFSQAGVVAPPDGPDFGNLFNGSSVSLELVK